MKEFFLGFFATIFGIILCQTFYTPTINSCYGIVQKVEYSDKKENGLYKVKVETDKISYTGKFYILTDEEYNIGDTISFK